MSKGRPRTLQQKIIDYLEDKGKEEGWEESVPKIINALAKHKPPTESDKKTIYRAITSLEKKGVLEAIMFPIRNIVNLTIVWSKDKEGYPTRIKIIRLKNKPHPPGCWKCDEY